MRSPTIHALCTELRQRSRPPLKELRPLALYYCMFGKVGPKALMGFTWRDRPGHSAHTTMAAATVLLFQLWSAAPATPCSVTMTDVCVEIFCYDFDARKRGKGGLNAIDSLWFRCFVADSADWMIACAGAVPHSARTGDRPEARSMAADKEPVTGMILPLPTLSPWSPFVTTNLQSGISRRHTEA